MILSPRGFPINRGASLRSPIVAPSGFSLQAARSSSRCSVAHNAALSFTSALTIELWAFVFTGQVVNFPTLLAKGGINTAYSFQIDNFTSPGNLQMIGRCYGGSFYDAKDPATFAKDTWIHWAMTLGGGVVRLYKNGVEVATSGGGASVNTNTDPLYLLDGDTLNANRFLGLIDEVRLWSVARSAGDILANYAQAIDPSTSGLVAYYRLNEGRGVSPANAVGSGPGSIALANADQWSIAAPF